MMHLLIVVFVISSLSFLVSIAALVSARKTESDVSLTRSDVIAIRRAFIPPNVGGRAAPSVAELQAARNRIDPTGTAHPGTPS